MPQRESAVQGLRDQPAQRAGGTPFIAQEEENHNPLGPVQSIGQKLPGF